jgi:quinohemoprotein amine dehydrogenase
MKAGSEASQIRLIGDNFPPDVSPASLDLGAGVTVRRIISHTKSEIIAEVNVAAEAPIGKRDVSVGRSVQPGALAIYDRVDYVKVTPESAVAAFGDSTHPRGYFPFEAIGYQRGADGKAHTPDDVDLGPVDVTWTFQVFHAAEETSADVVGNVNDLGLLTPAAENPGNNFDCWVIATARFEKNKSNAPLVGKSYVVVTVPTYVFNGRQYVRELDRWVDDGPAPDKH